MCSPVGLAIASFAQQKMEQDRIKEEQDKQKRLATEQANKEAQQQQIFIEEENKRLDQEAQAEKSQLAQDALREQASMRAAQASSGIGGATVDRKFASQQIQSDINKGILDTNIESKKTQLGKESIGVEVQRKSTLNRIGAQQSSGPGKLSSTLGLGLAGLQGYQTGQNFQNSFKNTSNQQKIYD